MNEQLLLGNYSGSVSTLADGTLRLTVHYGLSDTTTPAQVDRQVEEFINADWLRFMGLIGAG